MAIAVTQSQVAANDTDTATSISITFDSSPTEGNLIVFLVGGGDGGETITWPTNFSEFDSEGTAGQYDLTGGATKVAGASEGSTFQADFTGPGDTFWAVLYEIEDQASSSPVDVYAVDVNTSSTTSGDTGTTGTTAQSAEIALGVVAAWVSQDDTASWSNSFSADEDLYQTGGYNIAVFAASKVLSSTGTQDSTASWSGTAASCHGMIVTIKEETATDATPTPSSLAATSTFPATSRTASAAATTSSLAATSTFPATARTADGVAEPSTLAQFAGFPSVIAKATQDASPSLTALQVTATFPAVTAVAINGVVVQLSVFAVQGTLPVTIATGVINADTSLTVLAVTSTFDAVSAGGTLSAAATLTILQVTGTFPAVTVTFTQSADAPLTILVVQGVFPTAALLAANLAYFYNTDVTIAVEVGFADYPLVASPTWTDISGDVRSFTISRGRGTELDEYRAGLLTVVIDNNQGDYDPTSSRAAHYPNLLPMKQVRVRASYDADTWTIFRGFVESWPMQVRGFTDETVTLKAVDGLKVLNLQKDSSSQSAENSGARVGHLLDQAGWPAGLRTIGTGVTSVPSLTPDCATVLSLIKQVKDSEAGQFYIDGSGSAVFRNRTYRAGLSPLATFGDSAGEVPYQGIKFSFDDKQIWNRIEVHASGFPSYSTYTVARCSGLRSCSHTAQQR